MTADQGKKMAQVIASALEFSGTSVSTGSEQAVVFSGFDALKNGAGWIDVRPFVRLTIDMVTGAAGATITVEGKTTLNSTATRDLYTGSVANGTTAPPVDKLDISGVAAIRILENGTATQAQSFFGVAK